MSRPLWIIGNWKQHMRSAQAQAWTHQVMGSDEVARLSERPDIKLGVAPPYTSIRAVVSARDKVLVARPALSPSLLEVIGQDVAAQDAGAFTGEIGPSLLADCGATGALIGHSERRAHFGEGSALLRQKLRCVREAGLTAVLCVGETLAQREAGEAHAVVIEQLRAVLHEQGPVVCANAGLLVAYEPVWAIGTGLVATPADAQNMHARIRSELESLLGPGGADRSLLYGGSVKGDNAAALLSQPDVDGLLVGGAALQVDSYLDIIRAALTGAAPSPELGR